MRVVIKSYADPNYRHVVSENGGQRHAERVARGAEINLNHAEYFVDIERQPADDLA